MHDPAVMVTSIRRPAITKRERRLTVRPSLIEVWHDEPDDHDSGEICKQRGKRLLLHVTHLRIKFIPWRNLRHRFIRCDLCGRRMNTASRHSFMGTDKIWHRECMSLNHLRNESLLMAEVLHRFATLAEVSSEEDMRDLMVDPSDPRDQFLLWYRPWKKLLWYRDLLPEDRWRTPNQHFKEQDGRWPTTTRFHVMPERASYD